MKEKITLKIDKQKLQKANQLNLDLEQLLELAIDERINGEKTLTSTSTSVTTTSTSEGSVTTYYRNLDKDKENRV
jgi:hypothetical protein